MARVIVVILLSGLVVVAGCDAAHFPEAVDIAEKSLCYNLASKLDIHAELQDREGNHAASNAFSAWCWSPNCVNLLNMLLGEDVSEGLRKTLEDILDECEGCFPDASVQGRVMYVKKVQEMCNDYQQFRRRKV